jgi:hypothetical protein
VSDDCDSLCVRLIVRPRYHLKDVIVGKIYFLLVRIKIKHMELSIIRRETTGAVPNQYNESETITKYEIMDGAPVRGASTFASITKSLMTLSLFTLTGETIPIRLFLGGFELTPTFRDVNKKFSTRYYLNLVLVDEENRRYFKQQEITVFRIPEVRQRYLFQSSESLHNIDHRTSSLYYESPVCVIHSFDDPQSRARALRSLNWLNQRNRCEH